MSKDEKTTQEENFTEAVKKAKEESSQNQQSETYASASAEDLKNDKEAEQSDKTADASSEVEESFDNEDKAKEDSKTNKKEKKLGKKNKKDKKDEQIEELTDRVKRQMAEFDNFRKRTEKEKSAMFEVGAKSVIEKVLPVLDNFERGLAATTDEEKELPFVQGMDKIYKQLVTTLEEIGVKPIEAVGSEFDPEFHNAVMHIEDENLGENVVTEEFQKGYTYRESVVRHSMVKVAN